MTKFSGGHKIDYVGHGGLWHVVMVSGIFRSILDLLDLFKWLWWPIIFNNYFFRWSSKWPWWSLKVKVFIYIPFGQPIRYLVSKFNSFIIFSVFAALMMMVIRVTMVVTDIYDPWSINWIGEFFEHIRHL